MTTALIHRRSWRLQVLTACNLASFSLSDCVHSLLGRTLEVLPADTLASLAALSPPAPQLSVAGTASAFWDEAGQVVDCFALCCLTAANENGCGILINKIR